MKRYFAAASVLALIVVLAGGCVDSARRSGGKAARGRAAEGFPKKDIRLVCPPKQGGLSDFVTRTLAAYTEKEIPGWSVLVENKPGAAGATGMRFGAEAAPDGYTITYVTVESAILKHRKDISDSVSHTDFDLLCRLNRGNAVLAVKAASPWKTFGDFAAAAKARPGKINAGNSGNYSIWHIAAALMADTAGIEINHVPYDGAAPAVQDLLGGHVDAVTVSAAEVLTFVQGGQLKVLAVFGEDRDPSLDGVPTAREQGHDIVIGAWGGLGVPKNTPPEIRKILLNGFKKGFDSPEFTKKCTDRGVEPAWLGPDEFTAFAKQQDEMFGRVIEGLEIK